MDQKSLNFVTGMMFAVVALAHVARLYMGWPVVIDTWTDVAQLA